VLLADFGIAGAAIAALTAEAAGLLIGIAIAHHLSQDHLPLTRATLFDRKKIPAMRGRRRLAVMRSINAGPNSAIAVTASASPKPQNTTSRHAPENFVAVTAP